jgi:long-subunit fatty acid transport protein
VLAGLHGPAEVREGASPGLETRVDQEATTVLRALAGARARAGAWRFGAVYRGKFASSNGLRTTSTVGGVPLVVAIDLKEAFFAPETWSAGASWAPGDGLELEIDAAWLRWSQWRGPVMTIDAVLPGVTIRSRPDAELWRDTWTVRGAGSLRFDLGSAARLAVSAGAGYEPSIQKPLQQGETNQVDGDKLIVGLGARLELPSLVSMPLSIGVGAQGQTVGAYRQDKEVCTVPKACSDEQVFGPEGEDPSAGVTNPGYPTLEGSGSVWALALGVQVEL